MMLKKSLSCFLLVGLLLMIGCNTNKPANEVNDAQQRVKKKVEDGRQQQKQAAEETGEN